jgi:predicted  nucleic acid-binding Zn-ribbon protein
MTVESSLINSKAESSKRAQLYHAISSLPKIGALLPDSRIKKTKKMLEDLKTQQDSINANIENLNKEEIDIVARLKELLEENIQLRSQLIELINLESQAEKEIGSLIVENFNTQQFESFESTRAILVNNWPSDPIKQRSNLSTFQSMYGLHVESLEDIKTCTNPFEDNKENMQSNIERIETLRKQTSQYVQEKLALNTKSNSNTSEIKTLESRSKEISDLINQFQLSIGRLDNQADQL